MELLVYNDGCLYGRQALYSLWFDKMAARLWVSQLNIRGNFKIGEVQ